MIYMYINKLLVQKPKYSQNGDLFNGDAVFGLSTVS